MPLGAPDGSLPPRAVFVNRLWRNGPAMFQRTLFSDADSRAIYASVEVCGVPENAALEAAVAAAREALRPEDPDLVTVHFLASTANLAEGLVRAAGREEGEGATRDMSGVLQVLSHPYGYIPSALVEQACLVVLDRLPGAVNLDHALPRLCHGLAVLVLAKDGGGGDAHCDGALEVLLACLQELQEQFGGHFDRAFHAWLSSMPSAVRSLLFDRLVAVKPAASLFAVLVASEKTSHGSEFAAKLLSSLGKDSPEAAWTAGLSLAAALDLRDAPEAALRAGLERVCPEEEPELVRRVNNMLSEC